MSIIERSPACGAPLAPDLPMATPFPVWQLDGRALDKVAAQIEEACGGDPEAYLLANRGAVDVACDAVQVTSASAAAVRLVAATGLASLLGPMGYLFAAAPGVARRLLAARMANRPDHVENMTLRTFDGASCEVLLQATFAPKEDRFANPLLLMIDVTGRLGKDAQHLTLCEFLAQVVHEVRQPLAAIATNAEASLNWLNSASPNTAKASLLTGRIAASAHHASDIIRGIQQLVVGHRHDSIALDFNLVVQEACEIIRDQAATRRIELALQLAQAPMRVYGDRVQLRQVVINLLVNAMQAMDRSGRPGRKIVLRTVPERDGLVGLSVRDTGPGIAPSDLERIFTRGVTTRSDGMGLGLAICWSIVGAHRGSIHAANDPEGGARFDVFLPVEAGAYA